MKLEIKNFQNQVMKFDFYINNMDDVELLGKVHVIGTAVNNNGKIEINGHYSVRLRMQCVRCLKELELGLENDFTGTFLDEIQYTQYLKSLNTECVIDKNEIYDPVENGIIDLVNLVREYIILDMPPYPQCEPDCEDSSEIKKHSDNGIDPRWQQLLQIKN